MFRCTAYASQPYNGMPILSSNSNTEIVFVGKAVIRDKASFVFENKAGKQFYCTEKDWTEKTTWFNPVNGKGNTFHTCWFGF